MNNTPPSVPDECTPTPESNILADDWNMTENGINEETASFDGKIIARMPDLGSNGFIGNIERQKVPSVWKNIYRSMMSAENRQQFFKHMTAFGGAVLLCGIGVLFFEWSNDEPDNNLPANNAQDIAKVLSEQSPVSDSGSVSLAKKESKHSVDAAPESSVLSIENASNTIPVADIAAVQRSVDQSSPKADSPWNRPASNAYSPWGVTHKQTENSSASAVPPVPAVPVTPAAPPTAVAAANTPVPPSAVSPPAETVEMTPMTPLSMPVSPYEQQLFVAQTPPPVRPPVDPFLQSNTQSGVQPGNTLVPGMVQTHERVNNPVNTIQPNNVAPMMPQSQYQQPVAPQGRQPINAPVQRNVQPQGYTHQGQQGQPAQQHAQHGQYGQYNQYAGAPPVGAVGGVPVANAPSQNMPIPSGVSTLPPQEGYHSQPLGNVPVQNNNFHPNATPAYRRVY